jgi:hypothetical protein
VDIILPAGLVVTARTAEPPEVELTLEKS